MKKLFAVLLTLCLVFSLPLFVMAEETTTAPETVEETTTAPETVEETAPAETESAPENESETESTPENETEAETEYQMNLGFYPETLLDTLSVMGMGMLGIFLVTCVIVLAVVVLSKLGGKNKEE
jgi:hypothetical protein